LKKFLVSCAALLLGASALAGCGSQQGAAAPAASDGAERTVRIGAVPVVDVAALYVGEKQGYFADKNMKLDIQFGQGGAALIPAMLNDQYDFIYSNVISALQAREKGLPLIAIAEGGRSTGVQGKDHGGLLVLPDSPVKTAADLEGKTVAVNTLLGLHEVTTRTAVEKAGGDPAKVKFVEMNLPDMDAALAAKRVDAIATSEPFLGNGIEHGARLVTSQFVDTDPDFITAAYLATEQKAQSDPALVKDFQDALKQSMEYASEHPEEFRAELGNFTKIEPDAAKKMVLTKYGWGLPRETLETIAQASAKAGILKEPEQDIDGLLSFMGKQ
jgi:NitT/TauT family transport system substrate-binding protein